jgi:tetratricopeptide (TPR) repeat protein
LSDDPYETSLQLGQDHERQGRLAAAIQAYEHASTLKPWDAWAFRALGTLYAQEKQFQKAADAFNRLDALSTLSGAERFLFGAILFELNDNARTIEQCDQAIRLIPGNPQPYLLMYSAYMKENKRREALEILEKYLKLFPRDSNRELAIKRIEQLRSTLRNPPK